MSYHSLTIEFPEQITKLLDVYLQTGCYGRTKEEAVLRIIEQWAQGRIMLKKENKEAHPTSRVSTTKH